MLWSSIGSCIRMGWKDVCFFLLCSDFFKFFSALLVWKCLDLPLFLSPFPSVSPQNPSSALPLDSLTPSDNGASLTGLGKWIRFHYWNVPLLLIALKTMNAIWVLWLLYIKNPKLVSSLSWRWGKEVRRGGSWQSIFYWRQPASLLSSSTSSRTDEAWCSSYSLNIDNLSPCTYQWWESGGAVRAGASPGWTTHEVNHHADSWQSPELTLSPVPSAGPCVDFAPDFEVWRWILFCLSANI